MSDVVRKIIALSIIIIGAGLLWVVKDPGNEPDAAHNHIDSTISEARMRAASEDPRLKNTHREERGGWIYLHLEGDPSTIGFQHGYPLGPEIEDAFAAVSARACWAWKYPRAARSDRSASSYFPCTR